jgi:hypothetical protein
MKYRDWLEEHNSKTRWDDKLPGLFGYRFGHGIKPWVFIPELLREIKYAWQRVYRGWDDRVLWSIHDHLIDYLPVWLAWLRDNGMGYPADTTPEQWNEELSVMIAGFEAGRKMDDLDWFIDGDKDASDVEYKRLAAVFDKGIKSFSEHFFDLWD